ncbi:GGDEF domain-containing protein [Roseomonas sp. GC11]|uniref:GGDEF domain-containing protein n=1 Tax=Roseomonas sp. GC11 TaxID=2950546 RepID=UPI00210CEB18|nr:GGDEF domain-containing protein [Roseomonas sp. GC11]MCQ4160005.1 GGDEF domain-containing protein [Roseomonas sp. GC11]
MPPDTTPPEAELPAFRRFVLRQLVQTGLLCGTLVVGADWAGLLPFPPTQSLGNLAFLLVSAVLLGLLWRWPAAYRGIARAYLGSAFLLFLSALLVVRQDEMRFTWFFPLVGAAFLVLGRRAGWCAVGASLLAVTAVVLARGDLSPFALSTFWASLIAMASLCAAFVWQMERAMGVMVAANRGLFDAARRDPLTGLANRLRFTAAAAALRGRAGEGFALVLCDLDHFKSVNDRHGHAAGDAVLVALGQVLRGVAGPGDVAARLGGEEFGLLLPRAGLAEGQAVAEALRRAVERAAIPFEDMVLRVTLSAGVAASVPQQGLPEGRFEAVLRAADAALYAAKAAGRNRVVVAGQEKEPAIAAAHGP